MNINNIDNTNDINDDIDNMNNYYTYYTNVSISISTNINTNTKNNNINSSIINIISYKEKQSTHRLLRRHLPYKGRLIYAFSLIELSIVLIIIGLLVAGVTGGKSLIESAKTRALMNEIRNYNQAFTTFYVANGRLPGDANRDGKVDESDVDFYDFKDKDKYIDIFSNGKYSLSMVAPWAELYDEKIIDFKPPIIKCDGSLDCLLPKSKAFNNFVYDIFNGYYDYDGEAMENKMDDGKLFLKLKKYHTDESYILSNFIKTNVIKQIDEKIDDGIIDTGRFRAVCFDKDIIIDWDGLSSYQDLKDGGCINIYNILDIN